MSGELILVGVDGSPGAAEAVLWAAARAATTGERLHLVHVSTPVALAPAAGLEPAVPVTAALPSLIDVGGQDRAERSLLESAAGLARGAHPGLDVSAERLVGGVGAEIAGAARKASLVVLGSRGHGAVAGLVLGSTGIQVSGSALCPTVIVRGHVHRDGPVVAGIDGSASSRITATYAAREALRLNRPLLAVHSWAKPLPTGAGEAAAAAGLDNGQLEAAGEQVLDSVVGALRRDFPELAIGARVFESSPAETLTGLSGDAVLVVGSRGRGQLAGLILGSTSQSLLRHASCPVAVVPAGQSEA